MSEHYYTETWERGYWVRNASSDILADCPDRATAVWLAAELNDNARLRKALEGWSYCHVEAAPAALTGGSRDFADKITIAKEAREAGAKMRAGEGGRCLVPKEVMP